MEYAAFRNLLHRVQALYLRQQNGKVRTGYLGIPNYFWIFADLKHPFRTLSLEQEKITGLSNLLLKYNVFHR